MDEDDFKTLFLKRSVELIDPFFDESEEGNKKRDKFGSEYFDLAKQYTAKQTAREAAFKKQISEATARAEAAEKKLSELSQTGIATVVDEALLTRAKAMAPDAPAKMHQGMVAAWKKDIEDKDPDMLAWVKGIVTAKSDAAPSTKAAKAPAASSGKESGKKRTLWDSFATNENPAESMSVVRGGEGRTASSRAGGLGSMFASQFEVAQQASNPSGSSAPDVSSPAGVRGLEAMIAKHAGGVEEIHSRWRQLAEYSLSHATE